jgi:hypothetical protein
MPQNNVEVMTHMTSAPIDFSFQTNQVKKMRMQQSRVVP